MTSVAEQRAAVTAAAAADPARRPRPSRPPLDGVRMADLCWMGVGAVASEVLGVFGALVIRIEDRKRVDMPRRLPIY